MQLIVTHDMNDHWLKIICINPPLYRVSHKTSGWVLADKMSKHQMQTGLWDTLYVYMSQQRSPPHTLAWCPADQATLMLIGKQQETSHNIITTLLRLLLLHCRPQICAPFLQLFPTVFTIIYRLLHKSLNSSLNKLFYPQWIHLFI